MEIGAQEKQRAKYKAKDAASIMAMSGYRMLDSRLGLERRSAGRAYGISAIDHPRVGGNTEGRASESRTSSIHPREGGEHNQLAAMFRFRSVHPRVGGEHTSQRPQHMDKYFLGNATDVVCFRVNDEAAQKVMARALNVQLAEVQGLPNFKAIRRDNTGGVVTR